jgi:hypothetical protein
LNEAQENKLLGFLYSNLKGSKRKRVDWIRIAKAVDLAVKHYGGPRAASKKLPISPPMIRSIVSVLSLPPAVQAEVRRGRILQDAAQRLATIKNKQQQIRIARVIVGMSAHDARQVIQFAKAFPDGDLEAFVSRIRESKGRKMDLHVVLLSLNREQIKAIQPRAHRDGLTIQQWIVSLLDSELSRSEAGSH